jgi:putative tricarboxylic transport membrane protein
MKILKCRIPAAAVALMVVVSYAPMAGAAFYDGKNVTVIVNAGAGGGLTRTGRLFMATMKKHLGTNTNMVIKNIAGGGGVKGLNFLAEKAKPDGLTVLWGPANQMAKLLNLPGVRFDPKELQIIGAGAISYVSIARADAGDGLKTPADLLKVKRLIVGGRGTTDGLGMFARLPLDVLGVKYRYVPGYTSQPKLNAAIRSREIQSLTTGHPGYVAFYENTILKSGEAVALYYHSPVDRSGEPQRMSYYPAGLKNFLDFYRDANGGKDPSGPMWEAYKWFSTYGTRSLGLYAPKGTDAAKVAALRAAFAKTVADREFVDAYVKRLKATPNFLVGKDAEFLLADYDKVSPAAVAGLKRLTKRRRK